MREQHNVPPNTQKHTNWMIDPLYRPLALLTQTDYPLGYHYQGTLLSLSHYNSKHSSTVFTVVVLHLHYKVHSG